MTKSLQKSTIKSKVYKGLHENSKSTDVYKKETEMNNPYNPSFGMRPERFLGREMIINEIESAFDNFNSPWRSTILTGVRGSGKTAILSDLQMRFRDQKAIVVLAAPIEGFLDDILGQIYRQLPKSLLSKLPKISKINTGLGASFEMGSDENILPFTTTFRYQVTTLLEECKAKEKPIVILIDEVQKHFAEMRTFVSTYQQLLMEDYKIILVMAGLPNAIRDILNDDILTFFRRSKQVVLDVVDYSLVKHDYHETFMNNHHNICEDIVDEMTCATKGYPYLIQLIGYYMWESLKTTEDARKAYEDSMVYIKSALFTNVHQLIYSELSKTDKNFILAMSEDEEVSKTSDISLRLEKDKGFTSRYRDRLLATGVIKAVGHGELSFAIPYMREFLIKNQRNSY